MAPKARQTAPDTHPRRPLSAGVSMLAASLISLGLSACEEERPRLPDSPVAVLAAAPPPDAGDNPPTAKSGPVSGLLDRLGGAPFDPSRPPPPAMAAPVAPNGSIVANQIGFSIDGEKRAVLISSALTAQPFTIVNDRNQTVFSGTTTPQALDPASGLRVHQIDFSALSLAGEGMRVRVGVRDSHPFDIADRPFAKLARDALQVFYQARVGEAVEASYVPAATPPLSRPAGHVDETLSCFSGADLRGTQWPGCSYSLDVGSGWYDAGDYGKYVVNTGFATWLMLNMHERRAARPPNASALQCRREFADNSLRLPEAGNGQSDLLDEARRGIDYMLSMQVVSTVPQALTIGAQPSTGPMRLTPMNAAGLVHHKSHGVRWAGDAVAPMDDRIERRLYPPSTAATLHVAGIGAMCARLYREIDPAYAANCLSQARTAFAAAKRVSNAYAYDNFTGGGPYDDRSLTDEFGWAATELYITTGEPGFAADIDRYAAFYPNGGGFGWQAVHAMGMISLAEAGARKAVPNAAEGRAMRSLALWAEAHRAESDQTAFHIPYADRNFYWGSNGTVLTRAVIMGAAHDQSGDPAVRAALRGAVTDALDYVLGRNPLDQSYVSGFGERSLQNPHHRFYANVKNPSLPKPTPGLLSGGPNNVNFVDPIGSTLRGRCTGMTCWADEYDSYSMNEVAINWNAALAWTAHWLDQQDAFCAESPRPGPAEAAR